MDMSVSVAPENRTAQHDDNAVPAPRSRPNSSELDVWLEKAEAMGELKRITAEVMRRFHQYRWPGNVRELRNTLESMMVLAEGETLTEKDLPERIAAGSKDAAPASQLPTNLTMEELERMAITKALDQCGGNRTHASDRLGISVRTLQRKLRQYDKEGLIKPYPDDVLTEA